MNRIFIIIGLFTVTAINLLAYTQTYNGNLNGNLYTFTVNITRGADFNGWPRYYLTSSYEANGGSYETINVRTVSPTGSISTLSTNRVLQGDGTWRIETQNPGDTYRTAITVEVTYGQEPIITEEPPPPPPQQFYSYNDTYINNSGESQAFELGVFRSSNGSMITNKSYFVEHGEMVVIDLVYNEPFEVGIRTVQSAEDGWIVNEWIKEAASPTATSDENNLQLPEVQTAGLYGDGSNNPDFPTHPEMGLDGLDIIAAIESATGSINERFNALKNFFHYMDDANDKVRESMLYAINSKGDSIINAISGLDIPDYSGEFVNVAASIATINEAVIDLDSAVDQWTTITGNLNTSLNDKADNLQLTVDGLVQRLGGTDASMVLNMSNAVTSLKNSLLANNPYATATKLQEARTVLDQMQTELGEDQTETLAAITSAMNQLETNFAIALNAANDTMQGVLMQGIDGLAIDAESIQGDIAALTNNLQQQLESNLNNLADRLGGDDLNMLTNLAAQMGIVKNSLIDANPYATAASLQTARNQLGTLQQTMNNLPANLADDFQSIETSIASLQTNFNTSLDAALAANKAEIMTGINSVLASMTDLENVYLEPEFNDLNTKLNDLKTAVDSGADDTAQMNALITSIEGLGTSILESDSSPEIVQMATEIAALAEAVRNNDITGSFDSQILGAIRDVETSTNNIGAAVTTSANTIKSAIEAIPDAPDPTGKLDEIIANQQQQIDIENLRDEQHAESQAKDWTQPTQAAIAAAQAAQQQIASQIASALPESTVSGNYSGSASGSAFPQITLPLLGTISFDPYSRFPWLAGASTWIKNLIIWASSAAFLVAFYKFLNDTLQNILTTPVQATSGGGPFGLIATAKQVAISIAIVAVLGTAIVVFISTMTEPLLPVVGLATAQMEILSGAPAAVAKGLELLATLIPMDHLLTLFGLGILYRFTAIPISSGIQVLIRVATI